MKRIVVGGMLFFALHGVSRSSGAVIHFTGTIVSNATLSVPSDFPTVQDALSYLDDKTIKRNAIVTVKIADGTYTTYNTIVVDHPNGDRIAILGNTNNAATCVIQFASGQHGIQVLDGNRLGRLDGLTLQTPSAAGGVCGILAENAAVIKCGPEVVVENWYAGIAPYYGSIIRADGIRASRCYFGVLAMYHGAATISYAEATYCTNGGFASICGGNLSGDYPVSDNNREGFYSSIGSAAWIRDGSAQGNFHGAFAQMGSHLRINGGDSRYNTYGASAYYQSHIYVDSATLITNNTTANFNPNRNAVSNFNSLIYKP